MRNGQISIELLAIGTIILMLFVIVVVLIVQKNTFTTLISNTNRNSQQCNQLTALIRNLQANPGYTETNIELLVDTRIEKNNIVVGGTSCNYGQSVKKQQSDTGVPATDYVLDSVGFDLVHGTEYGVKKTDEGIVFCETETDGEPNAWC